MSFPLALLEIILLTGLVGNPSSCEGKDSGQAGMTKNGINEGGYLSPTYL